MSFSIPNLDKISKDNPYAGEALQKVQKYVNENTTQAAGNKQAAPPKSISNPSGT